MQHAEIVTASQSEASGAMLSGAPRRPDLCVEPVGGAGRLTQEEDHGAVVDVKEETVGMRYCEK